MIKGTTAQQDTKRMTEEATDGFGENTYRLLKEAPRNWQIMNDREAIYKLIEEKLHRRPLYLKGTYPAAEFSPGERRENGLVFYCNPSIKLTTQITLFITLNRQLEIDFSLAEQIGPGHVVLVPLQARVGAVQRAFPRIPVKDTEVVATNFRISPNKIAPNNTKLQITTQVIFPEFEKLHQPDFNGLRVLLAGDPRLPVELAKLQPEKGIEVKIQDQPHFIQPVHVFEDRKNTLLALIFFPIPQTGMTSELVSRSEELAEELLTKVIDANAILVKEKQKVLNVSEGGVALQIDNELLKKNLPLRDWLTFDLLFRLQAPIRFHGSVRHIAVKNGTWVVGIDLSGQGHSDYRKSTKEVYRSLIQKLMRS